MPNRREFLKSTGALALGSSMPLVALSSDLPPLHTRLIPGTDESLPIVGFGNARPFGEGDLELTRQLLDIFMSRGGAYVDASGRGRFTVGEVMRERNAQDQLFPGTYAASMDARAVREELHRVRHAYGDEILDLVVTRNINDFVNRADDYRALKEEGITRYIGVARHQQQFHETMIGLMEADAVDFVQVNYSLFETEADEKLLPMARDKGVAILINRPFMNGDFFSVVRGHELPEWAAEFDCESWAQFSLNFILSHPAVNCVLTETANPKHAIDNLGAGVGRLPDEKTRSKMLELVQALA